MTEVVEIEGHHVLLRDESEDTRFVLTHCPVDGCRQRLEGAKHLDAEERPGVGRPRPVSVHLAEHHGPECFGLGAHTQQDYQQRLTDVGPELATDGGERR